MSKRLKEERQKVLLGHQNVWSKCFASVVLLHFWSFDTNSFSFCLGLNTIAVTPEHQRKGVGRMLLDWGCDVADKNNLNCFVMASPDGLGLYGKFDLEVVGEVCTEHGIFTRMFLKTQDRSLGGVMLDSKSFIDL